MFFRVLGPVDVWAQERSCPVGPWKEQLILAVLLLESGRVISAQSLAERVWDERVPDKARATLQTYISRLRRRLSDGGDTIGVITSSAAGGYRLDCVAEQVDARRFNRLVAAARAASAGNDPRTAREMLIEAEQLWRGEPLEGLSGQWAEATRQALLERRRGALFARIALDLQLETDHGDAISELTELTATGRIDQAAIETLIRALASAGRQDEALAVYRTARARLREELGTDPRPELATLHQEILRGNAPAAHPVHAPVRRGALAPNTLDRDPPHLVGREEPVHDLLAHVAADLENPGGAALYAIDGMPGIGKSAVAVKAAHQLTDQCPDGALQINFRTHDPRQPPLTPRTALILLLEALGAAPDELGRAASLDELTSLWRRRTRALRLLILLDDVPDADQITPLIPTSPGCVTLLTSRRRLQHLPGARHHTLPVLSDVAAVRLLTRITGRRFPNQARDLRRFASYCGGLPLALAVASAHLRSHPSWTLTNLVDRLETSAPAAERDQLAAPVHRAFELSYRMLAPAHRRLLRLVASQPIPEISTHAAAALAGDDPETADLVLESLAEQHLLEEVARHRYRLHDLLRGFAAHAASTEDDPAEITAAVERMFAFYLAAAAHAEHTVRPNRRIAVRVPTGPPHDQLALDQPDLARSWLDQESSTLLTIAAITDTAPASQHAGVAATILAHHLDRRGHWPQALDVLTRALDAITSTTNTAQAHADPAQLHVHLAAAHMRLGQLEQARRHATAALETWRAREDRRGQADALLELGRSHWYGGHLDRAITAFDQSAALYRRMNHPSGQVHADYHRAIALFQQARHQEAITVANRALDAVGPLHDPALECEVLLNLAEMHRHNGNDQHARNALERARHLAEPGRDPQIQAALAINTGILQHRAGDEQDAIASLHSALELFETLNDDGSRIDALEALAAAHRTDGALLAAHEYIAQAETLLAHVRDPQRAARIETETANLLRAEHRDREAADRLYRALDLAQRAHAPLEQAHAHRVLGEHLARQGDPRAASTHLRQARSLYQRLGHHDAAHLCDG